MGLKFRGFNKENQEELQTVSSAGEPEVNQETSAGIESIGT